MIVLNDSQLVEKELKQANNIIKEIAAENEYITPISPADHVLFEGMFDKEDQHTYGNSWIYVTQGTYGIGPNKTTGATGAKAKKGVGKAKGATKGPRAPNDQGDIEINLDGQGNII